MSTLSLSVSTSASAGSSRYTLLVAQRQADVRAAQLLRYQVFAEEMGAQVHNELPGVETDAFDEFCDHLIVRDDSLNLYGFATE